MLAKSLIVGHNSPRERSLSARFPDSPIVTLCLSTKKSTVLVEMEVVHRYHVNFVYTDIFSWRDKENKGMGRWEMRGSPPTARP